MTAWLNAARVWAAVDVVVVDVDVVSSSRVSVLCCACVSDEEDEEDKEDEEE